MAKQRIAIELDDETVACLATLGKPADVLTRLAHSAADGVRRPDREKRELTDESLRVERDKADTDTAEEQIANEVLQTARERADQVVRTARDAAEHGNVTESNAATADSAQARVVLERERSVADHALAYERAARKLERAASLAVERDATDKDLSGERAIADSVLVDQREANQKMVSATIQAHELAAEADLARERFERREQALRAEAEVREMFIGILGHDLRNPLGSIVAGATLLLGRGLLDDRDQLTATRIIRATQRITRMITQLLDLTRIRLGGGMLIEPAPTDLREVCRDIVEEFDARVELSVLGDVTGMWDQDRIAEVLSNILGNAVQHATTGTAVLVKARTDGTDVIVEVTNRGDVIPAEALANIFEPFYRAKARRPKGDNLGLGLYIARTLVVAHGGTLTAHSADGATTFVIRLPRGVVPVIPGT